jgi:hypothetical protein
VVLVGDPCQLPPTVQVVGVWCLLVTPASCPPLC